MKRTLFLLLLLPALTVGAASPPKPGPLPPAVPPATQPAPKPESTLTLPDGTKATASQVFAALQQQQTTIQRLQEENAHLRDQVGKLIDLLTALKPAAPAAKP